MSHLISRAGHLIRIGGHLANNLNCCKDCIDCEANCDPGTRPPTFDMTADHGLWYSEDTPCQYDFGGTNTSPYAGSFELQWLGLFDGLCRWYYCGDDPCETGKKFVWTLAYFLPDNLSLSIWYACDIADCERQSIIDCLNAGQGVAGGYGGFDRFNKDFQSETDCCLIDQDTIPWVGFSGTHHVTITGGALYLTATATGC